MTNRKLKQILEAHKMWLNGKDGLSYADLTRANLSYADLTRANLKGANLKGAVLKGANLKGAVLTGADLSYAVLTGADLSYADLTEADLDYSAWPLWCGSLSAHIDDRIARQFLYHLMRPCLVSLDVSEDFKTALFTPKLIAQANLFHRVAECGKIVAPEKEVQE